MCCVPALAVHLFVSDVFEQLLEKKWDTRIKECLIMSILFDVICELIWKDSCCHTQWPSLNMHIQSLSLAEYLLNSYLFPFYLMYRSPHCPVFTLEDHLVLFHIMYKILSLPSNFKVGYILKNADNTDIQ